MTLREKIEASEYDDLVAELMADVIDGLEHRLADEDLLDEIDRRRPR